MNTPIKILLLGILVIQFASIGSTFSYFSDAEYSVGNVFTAAVWDTQASFLEFDYTKTHLTGNALTLLDTTIKNIGNENITIDMIQLYWNETESGVANVTKICFKTNNDFIFFSGTNRSGQIINGTDYKIEPYQPKSGEVNFYFDAPVSYPFTIKVIMGDGASKSVTIIDDRQTT
ncbi:MAG: hypothetical protein Q7J10_06730 [Methanosarcinaceae archaeon]|nr:hypothetical protein [Methanosarcinaceae archaeon]